MKTHSCRHRLHEYRLRMKYGSRYTSARFAANYDHGKSFEDYQGSLVIEVQNIVDINGARVIDVGAGTGQLVRKLGARVAEYHGFDVAPAMVAYAKRRFRHDIDAGRIHFGVAPAEAIPMENGIADATVFPWSMTSVVSPYWEGDWRARVDMVIAEATRVTRAGGSVLVIETASLLDEVPEGEIWHPVRRAFLSYLEDAHGFRKRFYRNDWNFRSRRNLRFYGELLFDRATIKTVQRRGTTVLSETAGIWWKQVPTEHGSAPRT